MRIQLIELMQRAAGHGVGLRVEVRQVAEHVAEGVAQLAVGIDEARLDGLRHAHVFVKFDGSRPEAQDLGAIFLDDLFGLDGVAERLVHGLAFAIEHPTVEGARAIGRATLEARAHQQRTVEPAAVLIAAFEIHVGRPGQADSAR